MSDGGAEAGNVGHRAGRRARGRPSRPGDQDWPSLDDVADAFGDLAVLVSCYLAGNDRSSQEYAVLWEFGAIVCSMEMGLRRHHGP